MKRKLIINGQEAKLDSRSKIAVTVQGFSMNITSRRVSYTNEIILPYVQENIDIFQLAHKVEYKGTVPYRRVDVQYSEDDIEIILDGSGLLAMTDEKGFRLQIYGGVADFFKAIKNKTLNDLDWGESAITWDSQYRHDHRFKTDGKVFCPVIQYGQMDETAISWDLGMAPPSFDYSEIVKRIITEAGFTYEGSVFSDPLFNKMFLPYGRSEFTFGSKEKYKFLKKIDRVVNQDPFDWVDGFDDRFPIPFTYDNGVNPNSIPRDSVQSVFLKVKVEVYGGGTLGGTFAIGMVGPPDPPGPSFNTTLYRSDFENLEPGIYDMYVEAVDVPVPQGDNLWSAFFEIGTIGSVTAGDVLVRIISAEWYNETELENEDVTDPIFFAHEILPDIKQEDFIKDWAVMFGLMFDTLDGELICKNFNEVIRNKRGAVDWTNKRDYSKKDQTVWTFADFAQANIFKWKGSNNSIGTILIDNETLEPRRDYYESIFKDSVDVIIKNGSFIPDIEDGDPLTLIKIDAISDPDTWNFTENMSDPGYRIAYALTVTSSTSSVTFDSGEGPESSYDIGRFQGYISWEILLSRSYSELIKVLQDVAVINRVYDIGIDDVREVLSPFQILRDDQQYFLIMKLKEYISDRKTNVNLFRL